MDFGYYRVDTVQRGKFAKKVKAWTDIAYVGAVDAGFSEDTQDTRALKLSGICRRVTQAGLKIALDVEMNAKRLPFGRALKAAKPYWDKVKYLILDDELDPAVWDMDKDIAALKKKLIKLDLAPRPIGATFTYDQIMGTHVRYFDSLDYVNIEAYNKLPVPPSPSASEVVRVIDDQLNRLHPKPLTCVMQGYDRNGAIKDVQKMVDIQWATWRNIQAYPHMLASFIFAYGREGGTISYPSLAQAHREINSERVV